MIFLHRLRLLFSAALALGTAAAFAQSIPAPAANVVPLAPLEVSAASPAPAPVAVTSIPLDALPVGEISIAGFAAQAPNFFVANNGNRSFTDIFSLRGLTNTPIFGTPAVTLYLDGLPLGSGFTFPSELKGFASGDLYRGPGQNTTFGRAGPAGVLQFTTPAAAPAGTTTGEVRASYGNFNARDAAATVNSTAANGQGDLLVVADLAARDGYITNTLLHRDIDTQDGLSALARLRYRPATNTELTLLFTGLRARDGVQPLVPIGGPLYTVSRSAEGESDLDAYNTALTAAVLTPAGRLSSTTSYTDWALGPYSNLLQLSPGFSLGDRLTQTQRNWNEELKLTGDAKTAVQWSVGAFFSDGRTDSNVTRLAFNVFPTEASDAITDQRSWAAYGEATFHLGDAFTLTPGLRGETNHQTFERTETVPAPGRIDLSSTSGALLPKLAASYTLSPQSTLFASISTGYKPGGFSSFTGNPAFVPFRPEHTIAYEAGATQSTADHRLTGTVRAFWYDISNYQIERSFTATDYFVANAPHARSRGAELELTWKPFAGLMITGGLGYTDVTLLRFTAPVSGTNFDGNRAPYVPLYTASLRAEYHHESGWFGGVEITSTGRTNYTEDQSPTFSQRSYTLLDARIGYGTGRWRVSVYGNNLANAGYYSSITPGVGQITPGAPRTFGVQATLKF